MLLFICIFYWNRLGIQFCLVIGLFCKWLLQTISYATTTHFCLHIAVLIFSHFDHYPSIPSHLLKYTFYHLPIYSFVSCLTKTPWPTFSPSLISNLISPKTQPYRPSSVSSTILSGFFHATSCCVNIYWNSFNI